ncbi:MAG: hypothetical protein DI623_14850 [Sphingomonas sanxanigenens]|uniref:Uncharacterized protein n=1 Tax=Sphingomonas sanxanigenens TaxID=397260 RepID=A0A2W5C050_9SPHN|nr:MAG: hypothetical protein DI623_14850 [Sphingomonas sanxanigenens]
MMDLNHYYAAHQMALMHAASASTRRISDEHRGNARRIAKMIADDRVVRRLRGGSTTTDPFLLPRKLPYAC